jgi:fructokinase
VVKLNEHELPKLMDLLNLSGSDDVEKARRLLRAFELDIVCLTRGNKGSLLITDSETIEHPGFQVSVVDTVGAGDAFTAAFAHHYLNKVPLQIISETANRVGAWVATKTGAMPERDRWYPS